MISWSVKGRLITGLAGLAGLSVAIGVVGWLSIEGINRTLNAITDVSAPTVETSDDLAIRLWEATKVAEEVAAADTEGEIDELIAEFETLMADYDAAEVELYGLIEDPATVALLDAAGIGQEQLVERTREMSGLRREYLAALEYTRQQLDEFDATGAELNARLSELADANETEMTAAEEEGDNLEARSGTAAEVNAVLGELFERDYPMVRAALTLQRQVVELQDTAGEYLAETGPDALARVEAEFDTLLAAVAPQLDLLSQFAETGADREAIDELVGRFDALRAIALDEGMLFDAHRNRTEVARRAEATLTDLENDADIVAEDVDRITDAADAVSDAADEEAASSVASATALIMIMLGIGLSAALALIVMVIRKVTGPINAMTSAMNRLAAGDTAAEVPAADRRDEIGQMAKAVQVFKDNALEKARLEQESKEREQQAEAEKHRAMQDLANSFDQQVGGILQMVTNQATELQATATQLAAAVEETEAQSGAATAAAGEASTNVQTMASATEELSSAINEVTGQLGNAASQLQATAKGARTAQDRMDELQATIAQIDQVVAAINNVAEQTNLLALNATIEAARAGEAGKGFAVVASEVKVLANSTRQMTESIAQQLDALKTASDGAVNASRSILQDVDSLNQSTTAIASSMEQQSAATAEIGRNAQKAAIGTEEVSSNMSGVQEAATDTSRASDDVHRAASALGQQAATLQDAVSDFLSGIRAA